MSAFHETYGYYAQGVSVETAILPRGWQERTVVVESASTAPGRGHCRDPHDYMVSKLVAGRQKDLMSAAALIRDGPIDPAVLSERVESLEDVHLSIMHRPREWLAPYRR